MADEKDDIQSIKEGITEAEAKTASLERKLKDLTEGTSEYVEVKIKLLKVSKQIEKLYAKENDNFSELTPKLDQLNQEIEELTENLQVSIKPAESLAKSFTGLIGLGDDLNTTLAGNLIKSFKAGSAGSAAFGVALKSIVKPTNLAAYAVQTIIDQTFQLATAYDKAFTEIARNTTNFTDFKDNLIRTETSMVGTTVTAAELANSISSLYPVVTGFTNLTDKEQNVLIETTAVLEEMGVAADTTAENIQFTSKVLGMTVGETTRLNRELFTFAQDLGVPANQVASDFEGLHGTIAALGDDGVKAFRALEVQFKATGIQASRIVSIVEQFDTFDGAAQAAGRLNAQLGGPFLNSLEMVSEVNPAKRFDMLRDSLVGAGVAFDDLDYYQKKAMASALGLEDASELALVLGDNMDLIRPPDMSAKDIIELKKQTMQFNTVAAEMAAIGRMVAIGIGPMVSGLKDFIAWILKGAISVNSFLEPVGGLTAIMTGIGVAVLLALAPIEALTISMSALIGAIATIAYMLWHAAGSPGFVDMLSETAEKFGELGDVSEITAEQTVKINPALRSSAVSMHEVEAASQQLLTPSQIKTKTSSNGATGAGGTPKIILQLQIGDQEFATKVNSVKVDGMTGDGSLADSITKLLIKGLERA